MLQGRTLWFQAQFANMLTPPLIGAILAQVMDFMGSAQTHDTRLVFAVKSVSRIFTYAKDLENYAPSLIECLCFHASACTETSLLVLFLETLGLVCAVDHSVTAQREHLIGPLILGIWTRISDGISLKLIKIFLSLKSFMIWFESSAKMCKCLDLFK